jgi:hypothetical protein
MSNEGERRGNRRRGREGGTAGKVDLMLAFSSQ